MAEENKRRSRNIAQHMLSLRNSLWPRLDTAKLWSRQKSDGWLSVPRPMPLLLQMMDNLSKGKPVAATYLDLWCRTYDDSFVIAGKHREMAFFAGFTGERAENTWASRMRKLAELGFIDIKDGPNGPISYVLIYNPYHIVRTHNEQGNISTAAYNALTQRMIEIRAQDLDEQEDAIAIPKTALERTRRRVILKKPSAHHPSRGGRNG